MLVLFAVASGLVQVKVDSGPHFWTLGKVLTPSTEGFQTAVSVAYMQQANDLIANFESKLVE